MLHITDNYYAISNNYGYTVERDTGRKNKDESPAYTTLGYVGTIVTMQVVGVYPHIVTLKNKKGICESFKWNDFFKRIVRLEK